MTQRQNQAESQAIEHARRVIEANRVLIHEIESDRSRENAEALKARAMLRKAKRIINRASMAVI